MKLTQIQDVAWEHKNNWEESVGRIKAYDYAEGVVLNDQNMEFTLNDVAKEHILRRLGVLGVVKDFSVERADGTKYDTDFIQEAINRQIEMPLVNRVPDKIIYDTRDMEAKAIKSNRYIRVNNYDLIANLLRSLDTSGDINAIVDEKKSRIDERQLNIYFNDVDKFEASAGDIIGCGFRMWNSETGKGSVGLGQYLVRLICTNGWVSNLAEHVSKYKHVGENLISEISSRLNYITNFGNISRLVKAAVTKAPVISSINSMPDILRMNKISSIHHEGITKSYLTEPTGTDDNGGINAYGIFNAVTRYNDHVYPHTDHFDWYKSQELMAAAFPLLRL